MCVPPFSPQCLAPSTAKRAEARADGNAGNVLLRRTPKATGLSDRVPIPCDPSSLVSELRFILGAVRSLVLWSYRQNVRTRLLACFSPKI